MDETMKPERLQFNGLNQANANREDLHPAAKKRRKHRTPKRGFLRGVSKGLLIK